MCKLTNYVRNCVVFWKIYTADKKFIGLPVATVATNSKSKSAAVKYLPSLALFELILSLPQH